MKVPCTTCGALILPTTAQGNDGLCMPCKTGIRAQLEESKAHYASLKEYDPMRELWSDLVRKTNAGSENEILTPDERAYFHASMAEGEVYNGGFDQFFSNSSGDHYEDALQGFRVLGADHSAALLEQAALSVFGDHAPPVDRDARWVILTAMEPHQEAALELLNKEFWKDPDNLHPLFEAFASARGLLAPFLR